MPEQGRPLPRGWRSRKQAGGACSGTVPPAPVLSGTFRVLNVADEVSRSGCFFRVYLPDAAGAGVSEPQSGYTAAMADADLVESMWCAYAWPVSYGQSGSRTF